MIPELKLTMQGHNQSTGLVVLGMHRSGTSACAGLLRLHGAYLGEVIGEGPDNPKGFWENQKATLLNEEVLRVLECRWDWPWMFPEQGLDGLADKFTERRDAIAEELGSHSLWAIKDPRMCLLWPWWQVGLSRVATLGILLCLRQPMQVAQSLARRNQIDTNQALFLWARYVLSAELYSRGMRRVTVFYDDILNAPAQIIAQIEDALDIAFPVPLERSVAADFISGELCHHHDSEAPATAIGRLCQEIFMACRAGGPAQPEQWDGFRERLMKPLQQDKSGRLPWAFAEMLRLHDDGVALRQHMAERDALVARCNAGLAEMREQSDAALGKLEEDQLRVNTEREGNTRQMSRWQRFRHRFSLDKWRQYYALRESPDAAWLFDESWYFNQYPDAVESGFTALRHYVLYGADAGKQPGPYFFADWYQRQYPGVATNGMNPLLHYLLFGAAAGNNPNPYFDTTWYIKNYPAAQWRNPLAHYLDQGWKKQQASPHPLFDAAWYCKTYQDAARAGAEPLLHYLTFGAGEGRNPHPLFHSGWYLQQYPRAARCANLLLHFIVFGEVEQLNPNPHFNRTWYINQYNLNKGIDPWLHYLKHGWENNPGPYFDTAWYLQTYPEAAASFNPLAHFLTQGRRNGNSPNPRHLATHQG